MTSAPSGMDAHAVDVLGCLRVRLVDAPRSAIADLEHRLPAAPAGAAELPTLEVRFVDELELRGPLLPIGRAGHAAVDGSLVIGRGPRAEPPRFTVRFDAVPPAHRSDGQPAIVCERAVGRVPHLVPLVNAALLGLGVLPLHASAVVRAGRGVAMAGWRKSGKTEAMLALVGDPGTALVADEWTYVARGSIAGIPGPVRLPLDIVGQLGLPPAATGPLATRRLMRRAGAIAERMGARRTGPIAGALRAAGRQFGERAYVDVAPDRVAGPAGIASSAPLSLIVLLRPTTTGPAAVREVRADEVAERMVAAHVHHRLDLVDLYWMARYAAPAATHPVLDDPAGYEARALAAALDGVPSIALEHPLPINLGALRAVLGPAIDAALSRAPAAPEPVEAR